jgi:pimeloyl-ACP methyl ester carboxylesterase
MRDRVDSTGLLAGITVPTLVVAGEQDAIIPAGDQEKMAGMIPGARYAPIATAGHMSPLERPEEFHRLLTAFLESLP